jgi:hypothetical protein
MNKIRVGDTVRMLRDSRFGVDRVLGVGAKGALGVVDKIDYKGDFRLLFSGRFLWWVAHDEVEVLDAPHDDAALAMALMLAQHLREDYDWFMDDSHDYDALAEWLVAEVTRTLLECA